MNWAQLLSSMTEETFQELNNAVYNEQRIRAVLVANNLPDLDTLEKELVQSGKAVDAIVHYRLRMNRCKPINASDWVSIMEAKIKVDMFKDSLNIK